jgi:hypothetical protein
MHKPQGKISKQLAMDLNLSQVFPAQSFPIPLVFQVSDGPSILYCLPTVNIPNTHC